MTEPPSGWDAVVNPTAYRRWQTARDNGTPIRPCGCVITTPHESHCDHWLRYTT